MSIRLKSLSPRPMATTRLLCVPFAGAGAGAFRGWAGLLPAHVEAFAVQLPAREERVAEAPLTGWRPMFDALTAAVAQLPPQPTAIFGHSLGAVIGFELARWMQHATRSGTLRHLFVSGRPWPGLAAPSHAELHDADDDALLAAMDRRYGSLSTSLAHPEIREVAIPVLRADIRLLDDYRYRPAPLLACPLTAFRGRADPTTSEEGMSGWRRETAGEFQSVDFDGGHFFLEDAKADVVATIARTL